MPSTYLRRPLVPAIPSTPESDRSRRRSRTWIVTAALVGVAVIGATGVIVVDATQSGDGPSRQQAVAERGASVMPFDLEATTHVFKPAKAGGVQTVVADDPTDDEQVALVRSHLRQEVEQFGVGDFGDPATIHGEDMPGLVVLEANFEALETSYRDRPDGGEITYRSNNPAVVAALHDWFDAQLSDHGNDAHSG